MNGFGDKTKGWSESSAAAPPPSGTGDKSQALRDFGSSINALSFGFLATAILVSMFLIMAIFEHLHRSRSSHTTSHQSGDHGSLVMPQERHQMNAKEKKNLQKEATTTAVDLSVLMPGDHYPTYIAQPAPLRPCHREGILRPTQDRHDFSLP